MEILKSAVLLANEHQSDQKNVTNDFRINFRYIHAKTTLPMECQKMYIVASMRILTKPTASVFHRI